jgi:hypothetical protein
MKALFAHPNFRVNTWLRLLLSSTILLSWTVAFGVAQAPRPVIGIAVEELRGNYGYDVSEALIDELERAGFNVYHTWEYRYEENVEVKLEGSAERFVSANGTNFDRVREASIRVRDLRTNSIAFKLELERSVVVLTAPPIKDYARNVVKEILKTYVPQ